MKLRRPSNNRPPRVFRLPPDCPVKPYQFQLDGVLRIEDFDGRILVADEMGLGKTLQVLLWIYNRPDIQKVLIVCPASIKWQWQKEAWRMCQLRSEILEKRTPPYGFRPMERLSIINYDILHDWLPTLLDCNYDLIVLEECHAIKNIKAKRTKAARQLCRNKQHIIGMSATPLTSRPAELFPIINILWPDKFPNMLQFCLRYTQPQRTFWGWTFNGSARLAELHARLHYSGFLRRRKDQVLHQLPPKIRSIIPVDISNRVEYDKAEKDFLRWIWETNPAKLKAAERAKALFQMTALLGLIGVGKLQAVKQWIEDYLEESSGKLILFGKHHRVLEHLHDSYRKQSLLVYGKVPNKERDRLFDKFREDGTIRILFGGIRAAGTGWNGEVASAVGFAELDWVPGIMTQAEDRAHRMTSKGTVNAYWFVGRNTLEERVCKIIQSKAQVLNAVLDNSNVKDSVSVFDSFLMELHKERR